MSAPRSPHLPTYGELESAKLLPRPPMQAFIKRSRFLKILLGTLLAAIPATQASAQTSWRSGLIYRIDLTDGNNYAFRVKMSRDGSDQLTDCADTMAYMNADHSNYAAIAAMLMTDYTLKRPITMVVDKQSDGFCRIVYVLA